MSGLSKNSPTQLQKSRDFLRRVEVELIVAELDDMKTKQTKAYEANQAGEWKCPHCKELTVCACVGHDENRKPIIRCMDCEKDFVDGKEC